MVARLQGNPRCLSVVRATEQSGEEDGGGGGGEENTDGDVEDVRRRVAEVETTKTGGAADVSAETFVIHDLTLVKNRSDSCERAAD